MTASLAKSLPLVATPRKYVRVAVPATSANVGPGFDILGMALNVWNELEVERADSFSMDIKGYGSDVLPRDDSNLVMVGFKRAFEFANQKVPNCKFTLHNRIPYARGMGSSSAGAIGGLIAGMVLSGAQAGATGGEETLLQLASDIEGHADNAAPCLYGGFCMGYPVKKSGRVSSNYMDNGGKYIRDSEPPQWKSLRIPVPPSLQCVLFVPKTTVETKGSRAVMPDSYDRETMIHQMARALLIDAAFRSADWGLLKDGLDDRMHQPHRTGQNPHLYPVVEAAYKAGAVGAYLSGSGPTVMALTTGGVGDIFTQAEAERSERRVADAMVEAGKSVGVDGVAKITTPAGQGCHVLEVRPSVSSETLMHFSGSPNPAM